MFHLLDCVPRPVSDALVAASISSAESATQCMNNVLVEIEKAFSEVPPSVKNAMAAAVSSVGATCEESLATIYFCFGNEFDRIKKEHELRLAKMESENRSLTLRVEQQANQLNILLTKHEAEIIRLYHQAHKFSQAKHRYTQNSNYGDQTTACTTCASPAAIFSSHLAKRPNELLLPTCTAMVNQQVKANIDDRIHHETNEIHQTQSKRDEEHHHDQKPSSSMLQKTGQGSCQPVSPSSSQKTYHDVWSQHYDELIEYKKRFGNCNVPLTFSENPSLGIWVNNQRVYYRNGLVGKTPSITKNQIRCLEGIGFQWVATFLTGWDDRYRQLIEYKNKNGNCVVPSNYDSNPALGRWVCSQRKLYKDGQLREERAKKLEEIGFLWSTK